MNVAMRVRVILEVGYVDESDDAEHITGEIESEESLWAGGDLTNEKALELFESCAALVKASAPI